MAPPTPAYHHGHLREALVEAADRAVRDGAAELSLRELARDVGVSANAAYRHFEDKAALLTALAVTGFERLAQRMQRGQAAVGKPGSAVAVAVGRFKATGRAYVDFALEHPGLFRVMFGPHGVRCFGAGDALPAAQSPWALLGRSLDALVEVGALAPEARAGAELKAWAVVHGFASLALETGSRLGTRAERQRELESVLDFAVAGLGVTRPA